MTDPRGPALLRWLAALLVRGPEGRFIRADLDDAFARDLARGISRWRAIGRYAANVAGSAASVWGARLRRPLPGLSWMDVKLGLRMLVRRPGLTAVAMFALGIGIPVGLAPFHLFNAVEAPLPVDEGDRIRGVRLRDLERTRLDDITVFEFDAWRQTLATFEGLGAFRTEGYGVSVDHESPSIVSGADVTAATFDVLRVGPLLGRTFGAADEAPGAPDVVVIGHDFWHARLAGDPGVIGRTIRIGRVLHTIVGVMPPEFLFPIRQQLWLPLRDRPTAPRQGRHLLVFGRLSDGASPAEAEAELASMLSRQDAAFPGFYDHLVPEVVPFALTVFAAPVKSVRAMPEFYVFLVLALALLGVACTNVGLLMFARAAGRSAELVVRTALGASRARIIGQMFTEALVLAVLAAGGGLLLLGWLPVFLPSWIASRMPYWIDFGVTVETAAWALALAVSSAAVAGVVPALRVTGRALQHSIQRAETGRSVVRVGRVSGALIVIDVAMAVAAVGLVAALADRVVDTWTAERSVGIPAGEYLSAQVKFGAAASSARSQEPPVGPDARVAVLQRALVDRVRAEPGIGGVAVGSALPRMDHEMAWAEVDGEPLPEDARGTRIRVARVAPDFFAELDQPILTGRAFDTGDLGEVRRAVIVNTAFVEWVLGGRSPIGRHVRYRSWNTDVGPWYEIVGVVGHLGMHVLDPDGGPSGDAGLYHPLAAGDINPVRLAIRVGDDPGSFAPRLQELVLEVDPDAVLAPPLPLNQVFEGDWYIVVAAAAGLGALVSILLVLAASGVYAIMSFSVAERTREIGIRMALGASHVDVAGAVARRSLVQLGLGVLLGLPIAARIFVELFDDAGARYAGLLGSAGAFAVGLAVLIGVALVACTAPTLRALRVTPAEALRDV